MLSFFVTDKSGNIAIMTALTLPVLLLAMLGGTTAMKALSERRELQSIAQTACNRAIKPERLVVLNDAVRTQRAQSLFDKLAAERALTIDSRAVTSGWLEAQVDATATIQVVPGLGSQTKIQVSVSEKCTGIPPYPVLNDVILSSNFKTPTGTSIELKERAPEAWDVLTPQQLGWDGGTGPGVEIQDWSKGFMPNGVKEYLPLGVTNAYVVELDSDSKGANPFATCGMKRRAANSTMFKNFELHPGTYRFSLWYRAREPNNVDSTSRVAVYLEGMQPVTPKVEKLALSDAITTWRLRSFDILVTSYGLYRLHVAAEGCSDSFGGLFNDLKLTYIQRPAPEYNDPLPSPPTN